MNKEPLLDPMPINHAIIEIRVRGDRHKIRHNTDDDHGLKSAGYHYITANNDTLYPPAGWLDQPGVKRDWYCRYAKMAPEIIDKVTGMCIDGAIGRFLVIRWKDPTRLVLIANDKAMIGQYFVCELISMTLFQKVMEAGLPIDNHESDLYVKDGPEIREILENFPIQKANATPFTSTIDHARWLDIPFSYEPWWIKGEAT